jgi:hypothetical protein
MTSSTGSDALLKQASRTPPEFRGAHDRHVREYYDWQIHRIALPGGQYGCGLLFHRRPRVCSPKNRCGSEIRYRRLFEEVQDGILILDIHQEDATTPMSDLLGAPRQFLARNCGDRPVPRQSGNNAAFQNCGAGLPALRESVFLTAWRQ